jgi:hypothetical protein
MLCFEAVLDYIDGMSNRLGTDNTSERWPAVSERKESEATAISDLDDIHCLLGCAIYRKTAATERSQRVTHFWSAGV